MRHLVAVRHNAEAAHRLPQLGGKCTSLHGHSWHLEVAIAVPELDSRGIAVEFAAVKSKLRAWVDTNLDHGAMLGADDPLEAVLREHGKVFTFGSAHPLTHDLYWPTVENVAVLLARVTAGILDQLTAAQNPDGGDPYVAWTRVQETAVNSAEWRPGVIA